jgi:hypothetical protein
MSNLRSWRDLGMIWLMALVSALLVAAAVFVVQLTQVDR